MHHRSTIHILVKWLFLGLKTVNADAVEASTSFLLWLTDGLAQNECPDI